MEEPAPALGPQQDLNALETEESAEHAPTLSSRGLEVDSAEGGENVHRVRADAPEGNERELPSSKQTDLPDMATRLEHDADKLAKSVRDMLICLQSKIENVRTCVTDMALFSTRRKRTQFHAEHHNLIRFADFSSYAPGSRRVP
jgi:hypothetical protein